MWKGGRIGNGLGQVRLNNVRAGSEERTGKQCEWIKKREEEIKRYRCKK